VFRLVNAYRSDGAKGLISKRRDFGPTLAAEKLREVHEIVLGPRDAAAVEDRGRDLG
jgi:hypothetical protein